MLLTDHRFFGSGVFLCLALATSACANQRSTATDENIQSLTQGLSASVPVQWADLWNLTASGGNLKKTSGTDGVEDGRAYSQQFISSGDGSLEFVLPDTTTFGWMGLTGASAWEKGTELDYGLRFQKSVASNAPSGAGDWSIYESGAIKAGGFSANNDRFRVSIVGGVLKYYRNDQVVHTSSATAAALAAPLHVSASLYNIGGAFNNIQISGVDCSGPTALLNRPSAIVTGQSVKVQWLTGMPASGWITYGPTTTNQTRTSTIADGSTSHLVSVSGLNAKSQYYYRVFSQDNAGNIVSSGYYTFTTQ